MLIECPSCQAPLEQQRFASFNTFGIATKWSDGYTDIFMLPEAGKLGCCPVCSSTFWIEDAPELGRLPKEPSSIHWGWFRRLFAQCTGDYKTIQVDEAAWRAVPDAWRNPLKLNRPSHAELMHGLQETLASTPEREMYLRTRMWWIGNHKQRGHRTVSPMSPQLQTENMRVLLALNQTLPRTAQVILTEGELLRQLKQFDEAVTILEKVAVESEKAAVVLGLAKQCKSEVCALEQY